MTTREISPRSAEPLPAHLADATADETALRRFLFGLPGVDPVGIEQRAAGLATRSIKKASKLAAIDLAISMVDLTTLEGADTPGRCATCAARRCCPTLTIRTPRDRPPSASTPTWSPTAVEELTGSGVKVASVATAFPSGRAVSR